MLYGVQIFSIGAKTGKFKLREATKTYLISLL